MKKLTKALEFYAEQSHYIPQEDSESAQSLIDQDAGDIALDVLNNIEYGEHIAFEVLKSIEHVRFDAQEPMHCPLCFKLSPHHNQDCKLKLALDYLS